MLNVLFNDSIVGVKNLLITVSETLEISDYENILSSDAFAKLQCLIKSFKGKINTFEIIKFPDEVLESLIIVGTGKEKKLTPIACGIASVLSSFRKQEEVMLHIQGLEDVDIAEIVDRISLRLWEFDKYKTKKSRFLKTLNVYVKNISETTAKYQMLRNVSENTLMARELVEEPANVVTPDSIEKKARELSDLGIAIEVLDYNFLKQNEMGGIVGVGQGSDIPPRIVILKWYGCPNNDAAVVLVGKGITFDSGGLNLKPSPSMYDMKLDMAGSAAVFATLRACAMNKTSKNVIGILGLAENLPSSKSQKPGDIVKMLNGKTVEVADTDAEGRLVLGDCLTYAQQNFKAKYLIDLATLTGAVLMALGTRYASVFSNSEELKSKLITSGKLTDEFLWELPMDEYFDKAIESDIADIKNIAKSGTGAGSSTAAHFLKRFIDKDTNWAHLDIAGVAYTKDDLHLSRKGASGFGVRLLYNFIVNN